MIQHPGWDTEAVIASAKLTLAETEQALLQSLWGALLQGLPLSFLLLVPRKKKELMCGRQCVCYCFGPLATNSSLTITTCN